MNADRFGIFKIETPGGLVLAARKPCGMAALFIDGFGFCNPFIKWP
jgi:hypothetical protein